MGSMKCLFDYFELIKLIVTSRGGSEQRPSRCEKRNDSRWLQGSKVVRGMRRSCKGPVQYQTIGGYEPNTLCVAKICRLSSECRRTVHPEYQ
jgi:hypothetical protein